MPNITSADVGYNFGGIGATAPAPTGPQIAGVGHTRRRVILTIPTSASNTTYPAGGVPLRSDFLGGATRGLIRVLRVVAQNVVAGDTNPLWTWNGSDSAPKLQAFQGGAVGTNPFREFTGTMTQNALTVTIEVENG
jgi:hypothetical protein